MVYKSQEGSPQRFKDQVETNDQAVILSSTSTLTLHHKHSLSYDQTTMSISRSLFHELRPFFRMLEEPFGRPSTFGSLGYPSRSLFDDPFFANPGSLRPAVDISQQGDNYVVEAELPGVKKENVNVRIGDGGRSLTIEGKIFKRSPEQQAGSETQPTTEGVSFSPLNVQGRAESDCLRCSGDAEPGTERHLDRAVVQRNDELHPHSAAPTAR